MALRHIWLVAAESRPWKLTGHASTRIRPVACVPGADCKDWFNPCFAMGLPMKQDEPQCAGAKQTERSKKSEAPLKR